MIRWRKGKVLEVIQESDSFQELIVEVTKEGERAFSFPQMTGQVRPEDEVLLNTTAVELDLGTGGYHFVAQITTRDGRPFLPPLPPLGGHVMKLRYTPYQMAVMSSEEPLSPYHGQLQKAGELNDVPVFIGELHSMLPILATALKHFAETRNLRTVYVMNDAAALPIAISRHVQVLKASGWLAGTITYGHAFGGDLESVNVYSALLAARHVLQADVIILTLGPGIVGTDTKWGFSGTAVAEMLHATYSLKGLPVLVPRISFADKRARHFGISHHMSSLLQHAVFVPFYLTIPPFEGFEERLIREQLKACIPSFAMVNRRQIISREEIFPLLASYPGPAMTTMGRTAQSDPAFFYAVIHAIAPLLSL